MRRISPASLLAAVAVAAGCSNVTVAHSPAEPGRTRTLPVREMPTPRDSGGAVFAIVLTGDGPVRGLADRVGRSLAGAGVPSAVWSSLRYYWRPKTPEDAAADLDRLIRHYGARWERGRVVLVGYSMGADVLPFLVNRLPPETRARVAGVALLALADNATFEFRVEQWWGDTKAPTLPTLPEIERMGGVPVLCLYGVGDVKTVCPALEAGGARVVALRGGHHFTGDHRRLKALLVEFAREAAAGR